MRINPHLSLRSIKRGDSASAIRACNIVLVLRDCYRSQNANDRDNDHQLDQCKTFLCIHIYFSEASIRCCLGSVQA